MNLEHGNPMKKENRYEENGDFITKYLNLNLTGASYTYLTITEEMDIIASGASILYYKGDGIINSQILTGASQIIHVD